VLSSFSKTKIHNLVHFLVQTLVLLFVIYYICSESKTNKLNLPIETLVAIKKELPSGSLKKIAEEASLSYSLVTKIFNGDRPLTDDNKQVISIANRLIRDKRRAEEKLNKEIHKQLKRSA